MYTNKWPISLVLGQQTVFIFLSKSFDLNVLNIYCFYNYTVMVKMGSTLLRYYLDTKRKSIEFFKTLYVLQSLWKQMAMNSKFNCFLPLFVISHYQENKSQLFNPKN